MVFFPNPVWGNSGTVLYKGTKRKGENAGALLFVMETLLNRRMLLHCHDTIALVISPPVQETTNKIEHGIEIHSIITCCHMFYITRCCYDCLWLSSCIMQDYNMQKLKLSLEDNLAIEIARYILVLNAFRIAMKALVSPIKENNFCWYSLSKRFKKLGIIFKNCKRDNLQKSTLLIKALTGLKSLLLSRRGHNRSHVLD